MKQHCLLFAKNLRSFQLDCKSDTLVNTDKHTDTWQDSEYMEIVLTYR